MSVILILTGFGEQDLFYSRVTEVDDLCPSLIAILVAEENRVSQLSSNKSNTSPRFLTLPLFIHFQQLVSKGNKMHLPRHFLPVISSSVASLMQFSPIAITTLASTSWYPPTTATFVPSPPIPHLFVFFSLILNSRSLSGW